MSELLPGEASEPAEGQGEDALPGLRLSSYHVRLPVALLVVALSGALLSLSLPPASAGPWLPLVAPIPLLWLLRGSRPGRGFVLGFVFGAVYFGAVLYWILLFGEMAFAVLVLGSALFLGLFGALAPAVWRPERPVLSTAGLAGLWTLIEWIRGSWPFGGFSWGQLGSTQMGGPLVKLAPVGGVWLVSFATLLIAGLLLVALERGRGGARRIGAIVSAAVVILAAQGVPTNELGGDRIDVAAIQVDVESVRHLGGSAEDRAVAMLNVELHRTLASDPPDLIVWGEGSLDPGALRDPETVEAVRAAIADVGVPTLAGAVTDDEEGNQRTEVLLFDGDGGLSDRYAKVRLVPFGEYVPFRRSLGWISAIEQIPVDRVPGEEIRALETPGLPAFGGPICYENSFPWIDRAMVNAGARFLVVTINNASYERTAASEQHLIMSRLRAIETGRWVVHAAISGISAVIDPTGRIVDQRGLFEQAVLHEEIRASSTRTPYVRIGDWAVWGSLILVLVLTAAPRRGRRAVGTVPPLPAEPRILVILPTYDERATIERVLDGVLALPHRIHVLVVDDASPDGTGRLVATRAGSDERIRLVERPSRGGLASAYALGFEKAVQEGFDLVVEMDSDLSHAPEELPRLLGAADGHDVVIGSRYVAGGSVTNWSHLRLALSRWGNRYARFCLGFDIRDATSGFRVYRREALQDVTAAPIRSDGYGFQVELAHRAWRHGLAVAEVPITFRERQHGSSKIGRRIVVEALWLVTVWGIRARLRPERPA